MGPKEGWAGWSRPRKVLIVAFVLIFICACGGMALIAISRHMLISPVVPTVEVDSPAPVLMPGLTPRAVAPLEPGALDKLEVHFVDVGQGDAILLRAPDAAVLVDGGEMNSGVVPYLQRWGIQRLDVVVATHPHADHIGGLVDVLREIPVDRVVTNGQTHSTRTYERFLDAIADANVEYVEVVRGDDIRVGSLTLDVLHPDSLTDSLNDGSVVLRLTHGNVSFLLTGDIEKRAEANLVSSGLELSAQILKVPRHASTSSSSNPFLQRVRPEVAIYSAGVDNRYGHPHRETLEALATIGAQILGTNVHGTIVVITDGETYEVSLEHPLPPRAAPKSAP